MRFDYQYETDARGVKTAVRSVPREGQQIFEFTGHYDPRQKPNTYYFYATSRREAMQRFWYILGWNFKTCRRVTNPEEIEAICTNQNTFPI